RVLAVPPRKAPARAITQSPARPAPCATGNLGILSWHTTSAQCSGARPMVGGKAWAAAQGPLAGIARMPRMKQRQREVEAAAKGRPAAALCYALAPCPFTTL